MGEIEEFFAGDICRLYLSGNVLIAAWTNAPLLDHVKRMREANLALRERYPTGHGFINLIFSGTPNFSDEVRKATKELTQEFSATSLCSAHLIEIDGMVGAVVRTFISTVMLMGGARTGSTKVFRHLEEATPWLLEKLNQPNCPTWSADALADAYAKAKAATLS